MGLEMAFSKVDITPNRPLELSGFVGRRNKTLLGIRDRIYCRTLMLRQGMTIALVSCDVLGIPGEVSERVNEYAKRLGIDNVVITATHTHYAPAVIQMRMAGSVDKDYLNLFESRIKEGLENAINELSNTTDVEISVGKVNDLCINRVLKRLITNDVIMIRFNGKVKTAVINFNCHPITLGPYYQYVSSDYVSYIYKYFSDRNVETLFLNGAAGDVNPRVNGEDGITMIGERIIKALNEGETASITPQLKARTRAVTLRMKKERLILLKYLYYESLSRIVRTPWVLAMRDWARDLIKSSEIPRERVISIVGIRIGKDTVLVACPCELSSTLGEVVKMKSPFKYTLIAGYANGYIGYVIEPALAGKAHYEVGESYRFHDLLPLSEDSAYKIVNAMAELLNELTQ